MDEEQLHPPGKKDDYMVNYFVAFIICVMSPLDDPV